MKDLIKTMRPVKWAKNIIIFGGLLFTQNLLNPLLGLRSILAFLIFCLLLGACYIILDLTQAEIKFGKLSRTRAELALIFIVLGAIVSAFLLGTPFGSCALLYFILTLAYFFYLKEVVILDLLTFSVLFTLTALAGTWVIGAFLSPWLTVLIMLLGVFLALAFRLNDPGRYDLSFIQQLTQIHLPVIIVIYILYTLISEDAVIKFRTLNLIYTIPFFIFGLFRFLYLVTAKKEEDIEKLFFTDRSSLINLGLWGLLTGLIIYVFHW